MIRRKFFDEVGLFDESFPVCEDYELWLRIACRYPVGLQEEPLTIKHGGHEDQLSKHHSLDYYRIKALKKLLDQSLLENSSALLTEEQFAAALAELERKCSIYASGCRKRGRGKEAEKILSLLGNYKIKIKT